MHPPSPRATVDDRVWGAGARLPVVAAGAVGLAAAPSISIGLAAAAVLGVYAVAAIAGSRLPGAGLVVADICVLGVAVALLLKLDVMPVALLIPLAIVAAQAHENGVEVARTTAAVIIAGLAVLLVFGPGPTATWRDGVALAFAGALAGLAASAGAVVRDVEATAVEDRAAVDSFRQAIITTVSHELRTPLTIIQGITSALETRWTQISETQKLDLIDTLGVNIASLDASILHFLDAGRLAKGEWELRPTWFDTGAAVGGVVDKLAPVLTGYDVQTRIEADRLWADEEGFSRALELLLVNACRFSPPASAVGVKVSALSTGGWELAVVDRGQGIPPRDLPHVFEPLWRSDVADSGVSRGAGLGLAIVAELAERHGGSATVTSARGRGSTFRVIFPAAPSA